MDDDHIYQIHILQKVSRTFALTIPQLPSPLPEVIGNAYLLCRMIDTIEDEPHISFLQKKAFSEIFVQVVRGEKSAENFSKKVKPLLSSVMSESEHDLIANTERIIRITHSFSPNQRKSIERCVTIMSQGMMQFQKDPINKMGLKDIHQLDRYCYYVAGVVGEMITELLCDYSPEINSKKNLLFELSSSFGQGLQMTNILKDIWTDQLRGACWLPRDIFHSTGFDLSSLATDSNKNLQNSPEFITGILNLISIAHKHLTHALYFTLIIPSHEVGIRRFCLSSLGMAVLTLRKIRNHPNYTHAQEVKISRRSVRIIVIITRLLARSNFALRVFFKLLGLKISSQYVKKEL